MIKDKNKKKGEIQSVISAIIMLIVGIGVSVMVLLFIGTLGGQTYNLVEPDINKIGIYSYSQGFTGNNLTTVTLAKSPITLNSLIAKNATNTLTNGTDYWINYTYAQFRLLNGSLNATTINVTYQWNNETVRDSIKNSIISSFGALEQTGSYLPIIVLAVVTMLVLVLILGFTSVNNGGGRNTAL